MSSPEFLKSARLSFALECVGARVGLGQDEKTQIFYNLRRYSFLDSVRLSTGSDLMEMSGSLRLVGTEADYSTWKQIGALTFCPAWEGSMDGFVRPQPDSFELECAIPMSDLKDLIAAERISRGPNLIFIQVTEGIEYGSVSGSSGKIWDVTDKKWVPVDQISFHFKYGTDVADSDNVNSDVQKTQNALENIGSNGVTVDLGREIRRYSQWIIGVLVVIGMTLALK